MRSGDDFDVIHDCIFCSNKTCGETKLPLNRRKSISNVETLEFQRNILCQAEARQDTWGGSVKGRVGTNIGLVAAEAKYHRDCAQQFFQTKTISDKVGKPCDSILDKAFHNLCQFLDENDECQYSLSELLEYGTVFALREKRSYPADVIDQ